jgi:hypothetical protein
MANIKRANTSGITKSGAAISDVPDAPTIGAVTDVADGSSATVAFTAATTGGAVTTYTATSTPGTITGTSATSPITVTGLSAGTAYTFKVKGANSTATGPESAASASVTPTLPPLSAFDSIATTTLGSSTASITFSSIPATYTHLQIRGIGRGSAAGAGNNSGIYARFNSDSSSNYAFHFFSGNGSTAIGAGIASQTEIFLNAANPRGGDTASTYSANIIDILDYANTNKNKTVRALTGDDLNGSGVVRSLSGIWMSTTALSSITLTMEGNFETYSSFGLFGIKGA